jgi:subtilisin family serine protease
VYNYAANGSSVRAYVIDTGVRVTHSDFGGRASIGADFVPSDPAPTCNPHGTHVAGTIGGTTYGVAKNVSIVSVRVLNCSGTAAVSTVINGVNWVTANAIRPAVANMSLGGELSSALDQAVQSAINAGVTFVTAAGNGATNACMGSPGDLPAVLTVAATDTADTRPGFSNFGSCVDLFAPGVDIRSASSESDTATRTMSGTSMSSPFVAGVAANYLGRNPNAAPVTVNSAVVNNATAGRVSNLGLGSPNLLLYGAFFGALAPDAPLLAATGSPTKVSLSWGAAFDEGSPVTQYTLYRGTSPGGEGASPIQTFGSGVRSYDDFDVAWGTPYYYQVSATNSIGEGARSTEATAALQIFAASGAGPVTAAGVLGAPSTVVNFAGSPVAFTRGPDNAVYQYHGPGAPSAAWRSLGGIINANPVAVVDGAGIALLVRGLDNGVWFGRVNPAGVWSGWTSLGGWISSNIAATVDPAGIVLFVRGGDSMFSGRIDTAGNFSGFNPLGGQITSDPVAVTDSTGVSVIARGLGDAVWYGRLTGGTAWTGWRYLGGQTTANIAATVDSSGVELFVRGLGDAIWRGRLGAGDSWTGWIYLGGQITSDPITVTDGTSVEVLINGLSGGFWHGRLTNGNTWSGWQYLGGMITTDIGATAAGGNTDIYGTGIGFALWHGRLTNGGAWTGWGLAVG